MHHWRLDTDRGPVHVLAASGIDLDHAAIVVYVHGYSIDADTAWSEQRLGAQFASSGVAAILVVPEAPRTRRERTMWPSLSPLLREVAAAVGANLDGPVVAIAHSGGYRTVVHWLRQPRVRHVALLDAAYGDFAAYRRWLRASADHRMTLVTSGTRRGARRLTAGLRGVVHLPKVPDLAEGDEVPVLAMQSQYGHAAIVESGAVIPVVLRRAVAARWHR